MGTPLPPRLPRDRILHETHEVHRANSHYLAKGQAQGIPASRCRLCIGAVNRVLRAIDRAGLVLGPQAGTRSAVRSAVEVEATTGFEPVNRGFADLSTDAEPSSPTVPDGDPR